MKNAKDNKGKTNTTATQTLKPAGKNDANKGISAQPDAKSASNKNSGPSGENL